MLPADTPTEQTPSTPTAELPPPLSLSLIVCLSLSISLFLSAACWTACTRFSRIFRHAQCWHWSALPFCAASQLLPTSTRTYPLTLLPPPPCHHDRLHIRPQHCLHKPAPSPRPLQECVCLCASVKFAAFLATRSQLANAAYTQYAKITYTPCGQIRFYPTHIQREERRASIKNAWTSAVAGGKREVWRETVGNEGQGSWSWLHLFACLTDWKLKWKEIFTFLCLSLFLSVSLLCCLCTILSQVGSSLRTNPE